ncbi:GTP-binding protein [Macrococcus capreoli]
MNKTKLILLSGFLGAGKTTTLISLAKKLISMDNNVAIITNDQSDELIDTEIAQINNINSSEITGGCFCCKFNELEEKMKNLIKNSKIDYIIAEAVGSCTDLNATVVKPLLEISDLDIEIAPLTSVVDPLRARNLMNNIVNFSEDIDYILEKQLSESDLIAINKEDLVSKTEMNDLVVYLGNRYPQARVISYSAKDELNNLIDIIQSEKASGNNILDIDYKKYARGEELLAWVNIAGDIHFNEEENSYTLLEEMMNRLKEELNKREMKIAHLKIQLISSDGYIKSHLVDNERAIEIDEFNFIDSNNIRVIINARIETSPIELNLIIIDTINSLNKKYNFKFNISYNEHFSPAPPTPVHRMEVV